ncbi:MAG: PQQ-like beta-propeller repeat protein, partial [Planctomycetales bacterium]|nr:PQQ-like beta-propeller repeat protein [Planctomycetales bacterium]
MKVVAARPAAIWSTLALSLAVAAAPAGSALAEDNAADAWPTYLHDYQRSGQTTAELPMPLAAAWVYHARHAPAPAWPPPAQQDFWHNKFNLKARVTYDRAMHVVSDGRRCYFGSSADDAVRCLDLATGKTLWSYFAEAPVRLAPTISGERIYFGSDDGTAVCLEATDGRLVWRRRIADVDRRLPGNQRMISAAPVRTDLLVEEGQIRLGAGLFPSQGAYQVLLDAKTGEVVARGEVDFSPQGYLHLVGDRLLTGQGRAPDALLAQMTRRGAEPAQPIAPDSFDPALSLVQVATGAHVIAGGENRVAAFDRKTGKAVWTAEVEGGAWSLAIAAGRLLVSTDAGKIYCFAAAPENADPQKPAIATGPAAIEPLEDAAARRVAKELLAASGAEQGWC